MRPIFASQTGKQSAANAVMAEIIKEIKNWGFNCIFPRFDYQKDYFNLFKRKINWRKAFFSRFS